MTSRALYSKDKAGAIQGADISFAGLMISELKRKAWVIALSALNFIMWGPVVTMLIYESEKSSYDRKTLVMQMSLEFMPGIRNIFSVGMIAVLLGMSCFWFLLSKKKTDLYHSLPVTRKKLFSVMYVTGLAIFAATYVIATVIQIIASAANGFYFFSAFSYHVSAIVFDIIYFLLMYNLTMIAVMLSGTAGVAFCAVGVLNFIYPLATESATWLGGIYFDTKSSFADIGDSLWSRFPYLSPMYTYTKYINGFRGKSYDLSGFQMMRSETKTILISLFVMVLFLLAAYFLYMKRPSEAAGRAIAFKVSQPIIRIPLVITSAFLFACSLESIVNLKYSVWIWIALVFGGVLMHCILEIIFNSDFKALLKHPVQLVICLSVSAIALACYWFDVTGYDTYLPDRDKIEETAVYFSGIDTELSYNIVDNVDGDGYCDLSYVGGIQRMYRYRFTNDEMTDAVYELAKAGAESVDYYKSVKNDTSMYYSSYTMGGYDGPTSGVVRKSTAVISTPPAGSGEYYVNQGQKNDDTFGFLVAWKLKNGRSVSRRYSVSARAAKEQLNAVYRTRQYKRAAFDIYDAAEYGVVDYVAVNDNAEKAVLILNRESDIRSFLDAYLADLDTADVDTISKLPIASVDVRVRIRGDERYGNMLNGYFIYPGFKNTLAYMEKMNADMSEMTTAVDPKRVESIVVYSSNFIVRDTPLEIEQDGHTYSGNVFIELKYLADDPHGRKMIDLLCDKLQNDTRNGSNNRLVDSVSRRGLTFTVYYEVESGIQRYFDATLSPDDVPKELIDDLLADAKRTSEGL